MKLIKRLYKSKQTAQNSDKKNSTQRGSDTENTSNEPKKISTILENILYAPTKPESTDDSDMDDFIKKIRQEMKEKDKIRELELAETQKVQPEEKIEINTAFNPIKLSNQLQLQKSKRIQAEQQLTQLKLRYNRLLQKFESRLQPTKTTQERIKILKNHDDLLSFYELVQIYEKKIKTLQFENGFLQTKNDQLKGKQKLYDNLFTDHQSLKIRFQWLNQNVMKYKADILLMKKCVDHYENSFYSLGKILDNKILQQSIACTERKLEIISSKVSQFEDHYNQQQLRTYQKQQKNLVQKMEMNIQKQSDHINMQKNLTEIAKQELIHKKKMDLIFDTDIKLAEIQKHIRQFTKRIHDKKLIKQNRPIRQKIRQIQQKIFGIKHSQVNYADKNLQFGNTFDVGAFKKLSTIRSSFIGKPVLPSKNTSPQRFESPNKKSNISQISDQIQKGKLTILLGNEKNSPRNSMALSTMANELKKIMGFSNIFASDYNQAVQYADGSLVPSRQEYNFLKNELEAFKKRCALNEEQLVEIRQAYSLLSNKNTQIFNDAQKYKKQIHQKQLLIQKLNYSLSIEMEEVQRQNVVKIKYLANTISQLKIQNKTQQSFIDQLKASEYSLKKQRQKLLLQIDKLSKQNAFIETKVMVELQSDKFNEFAQMQDKLQKLAKFQQILDQKDLILQQQLQQNLNLGNIRQRNEQKIRQLQGKLSKIENDMKHQTRSLGDLRRQLQRQMRANEGLVTAQLMNQTQQGDFRREFDVKRKQLQKQISKLQRTIQKLKSKGQQQDERWQKQVKKWQRKYKKIQDKHIGVKQKYEKLKQSISIHGYKSGSDGIEDISQILSYNGNGNGMGKSMI